jgi:alpha-tubulin suppressor-like RCC1 family protein
MKRSKIALFVFMIFGMFILGSCVELDLADLNVTIEFNTVGGTLVEPIVVRRGQSFVLPVPEKEGHAFLGWFTSEEPNGTEFTGEIPVVSRVLLYARWQPMTFTIRYYSLIDDACESSITFHPDEIVTHIEYGSEHFAGLTSFGRIMTWGSNHNGQLGNGTTTHQDHLEDITDRMPLENDDHVIQISLGGSFSSALSQEGRLFMWGINSYGQLGDGTTDDRHSPIEITDYISLAEDDQIAQVSVGGVHAIAVSQKGRVFTWGSNWDGALGDDSNMDQHHPVEITQHVNLIENESIAKVELGNDSSSLLTSMGRLFMWGRNDLGQLGDGTYEHKKTPHEVTNHFLLFDDEIIRDISFGNGHASALTSDHRVFTWGFNGLGQLGDGTIIKRSTPIDLTDRFVMDDDDYIVSVRLGGEHSSALSSKGKLFMWGWNDYGQLGNNSTDDLKVPHDMSSHFDLAETERLTQVALGGYGSSVITTSGLIYRWGYVLNENAILPRLHTDFYRPLPLLEEDYVFDSIIETYVPTRENDRFLGWYYDIEGNHVFDLERMPANDISVFARWQAIND